MAHAWLFHGPAGVGKARFARAAAASLLCESPRGGFACGECDACLWVRHGNHPDLRLLRPEAVAQAEGQPEAAGEDAVPARTKSASREIRVEQVRELETWLNTATHRGGSRVVVLYPAQALNAISGNALLKVLEEPPEHTLFLLVADALDRLLPTLVSRCRRLALTAPDADAAAAWLRAAGLAEPGRIHAYLAAAGGAPLAALQAHEQGGAPYPAWLPRWLGALAEGRGSAIAAELVPELEKMPASEWLGVLQRAFVDLMRVQAGVGVRYYPELQASIGAGAARLSRVAAAQHARWLATQQRVANHPLSPALFVHSVLLRVASETPAAAR
ncbi:DNA polymerase III subunit delta' [Verticiella sediminum]|uniref:DNA polymerase III subunit delta n=2 Tax=Verticiella sediminum TaxID=1247510 RepID=A0A556AZ20_9BURK|nr:DNA polymerase III subunit delta' [Verticiella sediminum]